MVHIGIRSESEVWVNRVQLVTGIRGVHGISLGVTVVIFNSEVYFYCVSHTQSYMDISAVFSFHGVLKLKYLIPMNICLLFVNDVQVILYEINVDYYDSCYDEECKDSTAVRKRFPDLFDHYPITISSDISRDFLFNVSFSGSLHFSAGSISVFDSFTNTLHCFKFILMSTPMMPLLMSIRLRSRIAVALQSHDKAHAMANIVSL